MRAPEMLRLIQSGAILPEAEVSLELGFPPAKLSLRLKAGDIKKLLLDTRTVSDVLRRCFVQRRILYSRFDDENRDACIESAREIVTELRNAQEDIPGVGANAALLELLRKWENVSTVARQNLQGTANFPGILRQYRVSSLPIIEALIALLPTDNGDRLDAEEKIKETRHSLPGPDLARISDAWRLSDTQ